ncbi:MAG: hypothetical protein ACNA70_00745 [Brevefilum sp.]
MIVSVARAAPLMVIQRVRRLDIPGEVRVNEGQEVKPKDVIAEASLPSEILMVEIADALGVTTSAVRELLVRQPGEYLYKGDMLAQLSGTIARLVRMPVDGLFTGLHQGKAVFLVGERTVQVQAGMIGVVQSVIPEYGAILSATGMLLQGMWGNGAVGVGALHVMGETWAAPLETGMLADVAEGAVLAASSCLEGQILAECGTHALGGLILGSLAPGLIPAAKALPFPVIVVQGFGVGSQDRSILEFLSPLAGKRVSLNATEMNRLSGMRPEAIIPLEAGGEAGVINVQEALRVGQQVRVYVDRAWGLVGEVAALPEGFIRFESGVEAPAAEIHLNGESLTVPQGNLIIVDEGDVQQAV